MYQKKKYVVQCNLDLVTFNLVTTCDLVTILQTPFLIFYIKSFNIVTLCDLVTVFAETKMSKNRDCTVLYRVSHKYLDDF